jgi:hypothetical protein
MPCRPVYHDGKAVGFACGRGGPQTCKFCMKTNRHRPVTKLCDFPVGQGRTCDAGMCSDCATKIREEVDYCPVHKGLKP